jgi:hypothetical protein
VSLYPLTIMGQAAMAPHNVADTDQFYFCIGCFIIYTLQYNTITYFITSTYIVTSIHLAREFGASEFLALDLRA